MEGDEEWVADDQVSYEAQMKVTKVQDTSYQYIVQPIWWPLSCCNSTQSVYA